MPVMTTPMVTPSPVSGGLIAGVVVAVVAAVLGIVAVIVVIWMKRRRMFCFQSSDRSKFCIDDDGPLPRVNNDYEINYPPDATQEMTKFTVDATADMPTHDDDPVAVPTHEDDPVAMPTSDYDVVNTQSNVYDVVPDADGRQPQFSQSADLYEVPVSVKESGKPLADKGIKQHGHQSRESVNPYINTLAENPSVSSPSNVYDLADTPDNDVRDDYCNLSSTPSLADQAGVQSSNKTENEADFHVEYENTGSSKMSKH